MITIVRSDGEGLVLSSARKLMNVEQGLVVDLGGSVYLIEDCCISTIAEITAGHQALFIIINKEWKRWSPEWRGR